MDYLPSRQLSDRELTHSEADFWDKLKVSVAGFQRIDAPLWNGMWPHQ
jgi:hypothetical protein